jgi:protein subunit release factor B
MKIEIHPGEGGADAQAFAHELAQAIGKHSGRTPATVGTVLVLDRL